MTNFAFTRPVSNIRITIAVHNYFCGALAQPRVTAGPANVTGSVPTHHPPLTDSSVMDPTHTSKFAVSSRVNHQTTCELFERRRAKIDSSYLKETLWTKQQNTGTATIHTYEANEELIKILCIINYKDMATYCNILNSPNYPLQPEPSFLQKDPRREADDESPSILKAIVEEEVRSLQKGKSSGLDHVSFELITDRSEARERYGNNNSTIQEDLGGYEVAQGESIQDHNTSISICGTSSELQDLTNRLHNRAEPYRMEQKQQKHHSCKHQFTQRDGGRSNCHDDLSKSHIEQSVLSPSHCTATGRRRFKQTDNTNKANVRNIELILSDVKGIKLALFGCVTRQVYKCNSVLHSTLKEGHRRGRNKKSWKGNVKEWTSLPIYELLSSTVNRSDWQSMSVSS
ncbi:hypothetical protein DPMN_029434 [Dreissena polymorpha]|uniref:Uncharacterized protein n=1 Tax=Dreissena polymorpha TaxID=45954 RepID=A0A9D4RF94_DREPO|nr:hypothetical protein DPMN_029434 [Dreissena polymorpha]